MAIELEGAEELIKRLERLGGEDQLNKSLGQACAIVERAAKQLAPKDTGELRRSITSKVENKQGIIFTPLEYAPYVEYGTGLFAEEGGRQDVPWNYQDDKGEWHSTSGMKPQPYMRPALNQSREDIMKKLREGLIK